MNIPKNSLPVDCDNENCIIKKSGFNSGFECLSGIRRVDHYRPEQHIFLENNSVKGIYFIYKGVVKVYKTNSQKDQIVRLSTSGDVLGHRGIGKDNYPVSAQALTETELCYIDIDRFHTLLNKSATLATNLMFFFAEELDREETKLSELSNFSVLEKGKKALEIMINSFGVSDNQCINHSELLSRKEIGELVGLTANQMTKIIKEMQNENLIRVQGKKIVVQDFQES
jgi:CRP/FNR family transcriptional regulator, anaerobic regulatory protein